MTKRKVCMILLAIFAVLEGFNLGVKTRVISRELAAVWLCMFVVGGILTAGWLLRLFTKKYDQ